jgi:hypothetical protein
LILWNDSFRPFVRTISIFLQPNAYLDSDRFFEFVSSLPRLHSIQLFGDGKGAHLYPRAHRLGSNYEYPNIKNLLIPSNLGYLAHHFPSLVSVHVTGCAEEPPQAGTGLRSLLEELLVSRSSSIRRIHFSRAVASFYMDSIRELLAPPFNF